MDIPSELYLWIFSFLAKKDIKSIRCTCKHFSDLVNIILFTYPVMKKNLQLSIFNSIFETSQVLYLPIIYFVNTYHTDILNVDSFAATVTTVLLSQCKPVVPMETISRYPHIQFYISIGYFHLVNVLHESNCALLENVKLYFFCAYSPMRYKILYNYNHFVFLLWTCYHLDLFTCQNVTPE